MITDSEKLQLVKDLLRSKAERKHCQDDLEEGEFYNAAEGGNFDDTFSEGEDFGEIECAREVLSFIESL